MKHWLGTEITHWPFLAFLALFQLAPQLFPNHKRTRSATWNWPLWSLWGPLSLRSLPSKNLPEGSILQDLLRRPYFLLVRESLYSLSFHSWNSFKTGSLLTDGVANNRVSPCSRAASSSEGFPGSVLGETQGTVSKTFDHPFCDHSIVTST